MLNFQYPRSDRRRCNSAGRRASVHCGQPFSILGRIGGDATPGAADRGQSPPAFQYPRSDRRRCNATPQNLWSYIREPFSILGRIGGDATCPRDCPRGPAPQLSVSSVGSEAMQRGFFVWEKNPLLPFSILGRIGGDATKTKTPSTMPPIIFQYPRSDRRRCNISCQPVCV